MWYAPAPMNAFDILVVSVIRESYACSCVQQCQANADASRTTVTSGTLYQTLCVYACLPANTTLLSSSDSRVPCSSYARGYTRTNGAIVCQNLNSNLSCSQSLSGQIAMFIVSFLFWYCVPWVLSLPRYVPRFFDSLRMFCSMYKCPVVWDL